ncbi:hypothetical protein AAE478_006428 [Parahypoxylon ruwenzoriense]
MSGRATSRGRGQGSHNREGSFQGGRGQGGSHSREGSFQEGRGRGAAHSRGNSFQDGRGRGASHSRGSSFQSGYSPSPGPIVFSPPAGVSVPDRGVTAIEDAIQASTASCSSLENLSLADRFPSRPSYGTSGSNVILWANYFALKVSQQLVLRMYSIKNVTPEATGKKLTQIVRLLLQTPKLQPFQDDIVTDFKSALISRRKFENQTIVVDYRKEGEDKPRANAQKYTVELHFTSVLEVSAFKDYLTSTDLSAYYTEKLPMIQALNIFMNHYSKSSGNLATIGASKTFTLSETSETSNLGTCLVAMRGFFASVRAATARILVNVNVSNGVFYQSGPLDKLIITFGSDKSLFRLEAFLKRLRVRVTHIKDKNESGKLIPRIKTIFGLANKNEGKNLSHPPIVDKFGCGPKDVEFWHEEKPTAEGPSAASPAGKKKGGKSSGPQGKYTATGGGYISVYDHFVKKYDVHIENYYIPVVNVGNKENPSYLPAQVCHVLQGQPANTKLDREQTRNMIYFAVRRPIENARSIVANGRQTAGLSLDTNPLLDQFGITVSRDLITVPGRVLPRPGVIYQQNRAADVRDASWNMAPRGSTAPLKFYTCCELETWSCLYIETSDMLKSQKFESEEVHRLMGKFHTFMRTVGINASEPIQPRRVKLKHTDDPELENVIKLAASKFDLVIVILPANLPPLYNRIKQLGDIKYGIHTICSVGTKITKTQGQDQYFCNEALKVNLKLGGDNQLINSANMGLIAENKTMVVGIDVTHPSPGSSSTAPSIAGMVASIDGRLGQWPGVLSIQTKPRQEMVSDLKDMLKSRLHLWCEKGQHTALPENILVYRDGVSEGQYQAVLDEEVSLLREACQETYPAPDQDKGLPRLTVIVAGKRHHSRFYPTREADADRRGNTQPGTVVDRGVTEARNWDFFLQAHSALQGTVRPAHYYVVLDEIFRQRYKATSNKAKTPAPAKNVADELQELTQSMCYAFGRATKAVSYCTPAYYADILCERARRYLGNMFEPAAETGSNAGESGEASQQDLQVHERLKDSMFYI